MRDINRESSLMLSKSESVFAISWYFSLREIALAKFSIAGSI